MAKRREADLEAKFQGELIKELYALFPGCLVLKNDPAYMQGILDLSIFYKSHWAMLEVKASQYSEHQPNQDYYVDMLDDMSFAAFIYPENKETILDGLQQAFRTRRPSRISQR